MTVHSFPQARRWSTEIRWEVRVVSEGAAGDLSVVQIPETCAWNPFVAAAERIVARNGIRVLRPGWCTDPAGPRSASPTLDVRPAVLHLHWPEKLIHQLGFNAASELLLRLCDAGTRIVQTAHNVSAHESSDELTAFQELADHLTTGLHVFSSEHQSAVIKSRPSLAPHRILRLPHPRFHVPVATRPSRRWDMGCFGRVRGYKRTADFASAFLETAPANVSLLVAGYPDDERAHRRLTELAETDRRLTYRPGFTGDADFWRLLVGVSWVALPYERIYSSGVLVAALQSGRRILSPTPIGGTGLYGTGFADGWVRCDPWDDHAALIRWSRAQRTEHSPTLTLPTWSEAGRALSGFYRSLATSQPTPLLEVP